MHHPSTNTIRGVTGSLCVANILLSWWVANPLFLAGGLVGTCAMMLWFATPGQLPRAAGQTAVARPPAPPARPAFDPNDTEALVEEMLVEGRFALLLRPQIAGHLGPAQLRKALEALRETMAAVPDGEVLLHGDAAEDRVVRVERYFLDRHAVTNRQFREFVAADGYRQKALWEPAIWPAVRQMVDGTGAAGPRWWSQGTFAAGEEELPVVGVCWYEAAAFARWLGKRLPSDAEWVKAASWPLPIPDGPAMQRRYPWGESMDRQRANLWGSAPGKIVAVDGFAEGAGPGGIRQLIGNVWEWTSGNFRSLNAEPGADADADADAGDLILATPMKSIRGGAFDTYFDNQATCQFRSGESPLSRRHNIGFRCAVGMCDLMLAPNACGASETPAPQAGASALSEDACGADVSPAPQAGEACA